MVPLSQNGFLRMVRTSIAVLSLLILSACGDSTPPKQSAGASPPVRMACATPEQAGLKARDVARKLSEARKKGTITQDEYVAYNNTMSGGLRAWSERQDLKAYCAALDRIVRDASLR
jgi:hypothetical protein